MTSPLDPTPRPLILAPDGSPAREPQAPRRQRLPRVRRYSLLGIPSVMEAPPGVAYSTEPRLGICALSGRKLVCKDPDVVVAAECAGNALAELVDIETTRWGVANESPEKVLFVSELEDYRDVMPYLRSGTVTNRDILDRLLVFDLWIVNYDRNDQSLVGRTLYSNRPGYIELRVIDLEKARILRGEGVLSAGMLDATHMRASPELEAQAPRKPQTLDAMIERICDLSADQIRDALSRMQSEDEPSLFPSVPTLDVDRAVHALVTRARDLPRLTTEALRG